MIVQMYNVIFGALSFYAFNMLAKTTRDPSVTGEIPLRPSSTIPHRLLATC
ncbi:hypothetical protein SAMD00023353_5000680 [Rosellinia necatrix]|uniref:Uncharacterized protein n=1 Tax=Rosellinia necatrix TaxID=77044 RepID=A0A1S8A9T3_ROSNE|nr:hypothetical protein SAMD00023353_5000680 [Rosellinia necatrix]